MRPEASASSSPASTSRRVPTDAGTPCTARVASCRQTQRAVRAPGSGARTCTTNVSSTTRAEKRGGGLQ